MSVIDKRSPSSTKWVKRHLHINRPLLPLKAVMFLFYGAMTAVLLPYITLHMIQVGITIEEVGIIYAILPFASSLGPPLAGMIADKIGNYKAVLIVSIIATGGFHTLLLTVDAHGSNPVSVGALKNRSFDAPFTLECQESGKPVIHWNAKTNGSCQNELLLSTAKAFNFRASLSSCKENCSEQLKFCMVNATQCMSYNDVADFKLTLDDQVVEGPFEDKCSFIVPEFLLHNSSESWQLECSCSLQCPLVLTIDSSSSSARDEESNSTLEVYDHAKHQRGFYTYLVIRIIATAALGTSFTMLDATTICLIKKYQGELGKQRLFGVIGSAAFAMCSGVLLDWATQFNNGKRDYAYVFYLADVILVLVLLFLIKLEVSADKSEGKFFNNLFRLIKLVHVDVFMLMMLLLGVFWGYLEAFLFIFLTELQASSYLLGFTVTLGALVGIPFLFVSDSIVKKIGKLKLLISAFFIYSIRFIGYSFIKDPWMSLPFEALEAVTIHLMGVSCSMFCAATAPTGLLATLQGLAGSCHYSIGRGTGSFVGGMLIATYGTRVTFQILGVAAGCFGILYIILYYVILRKYETMTPRKISVPERQSTATSFLPVSQEEEDNESKSDTMKV